MEGQSYALEPRRQGTAQGQLQWADGKARGYTNHREQGTEATRTPMGRFQLGNSSSPREVMQWQGLLVAPSVDFTISEDLRGFQK